MQAVFEKQEANNWQQRFLQKQVAICFRHRQGELEIWLYLA